VVGGNPGYLKMVGEELREGASVEEGEQSVVGYTPDTIRVWIMVASSHLQVEVRSLQIIT
jgi:hypothetical protein